MLTHTFVRRAGFLVVLITGVGCAGYVFAAEGEAREKSKKAGTEIPRELALRPLPTYRIEPPDIIQIEVTSSKTAPSAGGQSSDQSAQGAQLVGTGTVSGSGGLTKTIEKALTSSDNSDNTAGAITVSDDNSIKTGSGTLVLSAANTYTGGTTVTSGNLYRSGGTLTLGSGNFSGGTNVGGDPNSKSNIVVWSGPNAYVDVGKSVITAGPAVVVKSGPRVRGIDLGTGQYLVGPDGTINMRQYGMVQVTGKTVAELKAALEKHLAIYMESPEVWINILGYNSKVFYIITDGAGYGDNVRRIPITGNETVLDAISCIGGLSQLSSKKMWLSRPSPTNSKKGAVLPIDYTAITQRGATETNYQIMPGDRIFIAGDGATAINNKLGKVTAPVERVMGLISLGASTIRSVKLLFDEDHQEAAQGEW